LQVKGYSLELNVGIGNRRSARVQLYAANS
jgi:hypothetical protein